VSSLGLTRELPGKQDIPSTTPGSSLEGCWDILPGTSGSFLGTSRIPGGFQEGSRKQDVSRWKCPGCRHIDQYPSRKDDGRMLEECWRNDGGMMEE